MQNKYVGDVGDFGKYALLKALCNGDDGGRVLTLGVVWYLVPDKGTEYLQPSIKNETRFRQCDKQLYDELARIVYSETRTVSAVERAAIDRGDVLPSKTVFFNEVVKSGRQRQAWASRALNQTRGCALIFLDPDNGLKLQAGAGAAQSRLHAYLDEVASFASFDNRQRSVVIYHHFDRTEGAEEQIDRRLRKLREFPSSGDPFALRFQTSIARAYLVAPARAHEKLLLERADAFLQTQWGSGKKPHFKLYLGK